LIHHHAANNFDTIQYLRAAGVHIVKRERANFIGVAGAHHHHYMIEHQAAKHPWFLSSKASILEVGSKTRVV
jgi:hypothetical protein